MLPGDVDIFDRIAVTPLNQYEAFLDHNYPRTDPKIGNYAGSSMSKLFTATSLIFLACYNSRPLIESMPGSGG